MDVKERIEYLRNYLAENARLYYELDSPVIEDEEYDRLVLPIIHLIRTGDWKPDFDNVGDVIVDRINASDYQYKDIVNELFADDVLSKRDKDIIEDPTRRVITEEELTNKPKMKGAR